MALSELAGKGLAVVLEVVQGYKKLPYHIRNGGDNTKKDEVTKVDAEPSWISLVPQFMSWLESGNEQQREAARKNLEQMAKVCDGVRQFQKGHGDKCPVCDHERD